MLMNITAGKREFLKKEIKMNNKFYKFHFKNDKVDKVASYNIELNDFKDAIQFANNELAKLNDNDHGYRIVGIYEILTRRDNFVPNNKTN